MRPHFITTESGASLAYWDAAGAVSLVSGGHIEWEGAGAVGDARGVGEPSNGHFCCPSGPSQRRELLSKPQYRVKRAWVVFSGTG